MSGVMVGFKPDEFDAIPLRVRKRLTRLMARVSEQSYRRGYQHGAECADGDCAISPAVLRFERSIDRSPMPDSGNPSMSAIDRFHIEYGDPMHVEHEP